MSDFDTEDEPELGPDDPLSDEHPIHRLRRIQRRLRKIGISLRRAIENKDYHQMALDFTSFDAAVAELATATASLNATISGDVSAAVAAQAAADATAQTAAVAAAVAAQEVTDQAALEAKVSGELVPAIAAFQSAAQANASASAPVQGAPAEADPNAPAS